MRRILSVIACMMLAESVSGQVSADSVSLPERIFLLRGDHDSLSVEVIAGGDVKGVLSQATDAANGATGSLGLSFSRFKRGDPVHNIGAEIAVAASLDTVRSDFATLLLNPRTGKNSAALEVTTFDIFNEGGRAGLNLRTYVAIASTKWSVRFPDKDTTITQEAVVVAMGSSLVSDFVNSAIGPNNVRIGVELGPTLRVVSGDVTDSEFLDAALGNDAERMYLGLAGALLLSVGNVALSANVYYFPEWLWYNEIKGLSSLQVGFTARLSGSVLRSGRKLQ